MLFVKRHREPAVEVDAHVGRAYALRVRVMRRFARKITRTIVALFHAAVIAALTTIARAVIGQAGRGAKVTISSVESLKGEVR
jgi:hypothetical protein